MKILIIEDEPSLREIMQRVLVQERYVVETASTYSEADAKIAAYSYDCILLDIMLPDGNGLQLLKHLKELRKRENIIIISARDSLDDKILGLDMGADDYLVKPFFRDELLARVHSLLRRYLSLGSASDNSGNLLQYYELTLNTELKKLYVRGDEIRLTATEYKIMSLLLSRPGRIFPAEEIYERVWEQDSYSVENTVMIHINRLRKKIELNPKKPEYLKVVWGIGYKIEK